MNINIVMIVAVVMLALKMASGYKKGMVKEIIMLVTLILTCITIALIANGLKNYTSGHVVNVIIVIVLLSILGVVHLLLKPLFLSAKLISKLPVVSWLNKLLGVVAGAAETVLMLWTLYFFVSIMDLGPIGARILQDTKDNGILLWFFQNNYLTTFLQSVGRNVTFLPDLLKEMQMIK